jgi:tRNA pseudouridine38-40 synthase
MPRYALAIEFDGTAFQGTQFQPRLRTLQQVISDACQELETTATSVRLSSRLDSGVSARHLTGDVKLERIWKEHALGVAFASRLPKDVVVRRVAVVDETWNAKRDAVERSYLYSVLLRGVRPVLDARCLWVRHLPDAALLPELAAMLVGKRDLSGFSCLRGDDSDHTDPRRTYRSATWTSEVRPEGTLLSFRISGEGFLYKQIRGVVGAMIHVAQGRVTIDDFKASLRDGRGARRIANMAPSCGLMLENVSYRPEPDWVVL